MSGNLSTLGIGGGFIKSIQRGTVTISGGATSGTATITSVATSKSILMPLGAETSETVVNNSTTRLALTNSTTITATRGGTGGAGATVGFQIVEYY